MKPTNEALEAADLQLAMEVKDAVVALGDELLATRAALRLIISHWDEFGPGSLLEEAIERARAVLPKEEKS